MEEKIGKLLQETLKKIDIDTKDENTHPLLSDDTENKFKEFFFGDEEKYTRVRSMITESKDQYTEVFNKELINGHYVKQNTIGCLNGTTIFQSRSTYYTKHINELRSSMEMEGGTNTGVSNCPMTPPVARMVNIGINTEVSNCPRTPLPLVARTVNTSRRKKKVTSPKKKQKISETQSSGIYSSSSSSEDEDDSSSSSSEGEDEVEDVTAGGDVEFDEGGSFEFDEEVSTCPRMSLPVVTRTVNTPSRRLTTPLSPNVIRVSQRQVSLEHLEKAEATLKEKLKKIKEMELQNDKKKK